MQVIKMMQNENKKNGSSNANTMSFESMENSKIYEYVLILCKRYISYYDLLLFKWFTQENFYEKCEIIKAIFALFP